MFVMCDAHTHTLCFVALFSLCHCVCVIVIPWYVQFSTVVIQLTRSSSDQRKRFTTEMILYAFQFGTLFNTRLFKSAGNSFFFFFFSFAKGNLTSTYTQNTLKFYTFQFFNCNAMQRIGNGILSVFVFCYLSSFRSDKRLKTVHKPYRL